MWLKCLIHHRLETMFPSLSPQNKNLKGPTRWQKRTHWERREIPAKASPEREVSRGKGKRALPKHCPKPQKEKMHRTHVTDLSERPPTRGSMDKYLHKISLWLPTPPKKIRKRNRCFPSIEDIIARGTNLSCVTKLNAAQSNRGSPRPALVPSS